MWGQGNAKRVEKRVKSKQGEGMGFLASATRTDRQTDRGTEQWGDTERDRQSRRKFTKKVEHTHTHTYAHKITLVCICVCVCVLAQRVIQRYRAKDNGQRTWEMCWTTVSPKVENVQTNRADIELS